MKTTQRTLLLSGLFLLVASPVFAQGWGTIKGQVIWTGDPAKEKREPLKVLDPSPVTAQPIQLFDGRYGLYVTDGVTNASMTSPGLMSL